MRHTARATGSALYSTAFLAIFFLAPAFAQEDKAASDITVTGKQVTAEDLKDSKKVMSIPKSEIMAFMSAGKPACKQGTTTAKFEAATGLSLDGGAVSADDLIRRAVALKDAGKISCLRIVSHDYDGATFDKLDKALVVPHEISIFWAEPDQPK